MNRGKIRAKKRLRQLDLDRDIELVGALTLFKQSLVIDNHGYCLRVKMDYKTDKDKLPNFIPGRSLFTEQARLKRLAFLEAKTQSSLDQLLVTRLEPKSVQGNIEAMIGTVEIPVGVIGPLLFKKFQENIYAPIATTEGALVSSVARGARALSSSEGVFTQVLSKRMTRAPFFEFDSIEKMIKFDLWLKEQFKHFNEIVSHSSSRAKLVDIKTRLIARMVHVLFSYDTKDAAGQNMVTNCTWNLCGWIEQQLAQTDFACERFYIEGNLSSDKKASSSSLVSGRGYEVLAESLIKREDVNRILRVDTDQLVTSYNRAKSSNLYTGMNGFQINIANVVAGVFVATGQDIACVHESSLAELHLEVDPKTKDLYVSLNMPNLVVGTVGGGVNLPVQRQMLEMMGCYGDGKGERLAEIICGLGLALDLSTISAIVSGHFAAAHEQLGRSTKTKSLKRKDLNIEFFSNQLKRPVTSVKPLVDAFIEDSMMMSIGTQVSGRMCALVPLVIDEDAMMIKIKATDFEIINATEILAKLCSEELGQSAVALREFSPFQKSHTRELLIADSGLESYIKIAPKTYFTVQNTEQKLYLLAQEYLLNVKLINTAVQPEQWGYDDILNFVKQLAQFHGTHLNKVEDLKTHAELFDSLLDERSGRSLLNSKDFCLKAAAFATVENPDWFTNDDFIFHQLELSNIDHESKFLKDHPMTFIHNDCNLRNIAVRQNNDVVLYDWELAGLGLPQRDLFEFLASVLRQGESEKVVMDLIQNYRSELRKVSGVPIDDDLFWSGINWAAKELILLRYVLYMIPHSQKELKFLRSQYESARYLFQVIQLYRDTL